MSGILFYVYLCFALLFFFFNFFGDPTQLAGSQFFYQGWNLPPALEAQGLNPWTIREVSVLCSLNLIFTVFQSTDVN